MKSTIIETTATNGSDGCGECVSEYVIILHTFKSEKDQYRSSDSICCIKINLDITSFMWRKFQKIFFPMLFFKSLNF